MALQLLNAANAVGLDWPRWRGPNGNGIIPGPSWNPEALSGNAKILWKAKVGKGYSSAAVEEGRLYTLGWANKKDTVYCLDADTGREIWTYSYKCGTGQYPGPRATPTVHEGSVYTLSREGHLFCFDAANGRVRWKKHLGRDYGIRGIHRGFAGSVVVSGDLIILNAGGAGTAADKKTGRKVWGGGSGAAGYATPVLLDYNGKRYAAIFSGKALNIVEVETGRKLTSYRWITSWDINAADPVVVGQRIFITSGYGTGCALLELKNNKLGKVWQNKNMRSHFPSPVYRNGYIYGMDGDVRYGRGRLICLFIETGEVVWGEKMKMLTLIGVGKHLVVLDGRGILRIVEATPNAYNEISRAKVLGRSNFTAPVFAKNRVYCRNAIGDLVCVDLARGG